MAIGHLQKYAFKRKETEIPQIDLRRASSYDLKALNELRRKLAKRANQRMRDLERAGYTDSYVYATAQRSYLQPSLRKRYDESKRITDIFTVKTELDELRWFLSAKTSTVGSVRAFERKSRKAMEEKGIKNVDSEFYLFLSSETFKHLSNFYSSEELIEFYDYAKENTVKHSEILKALEEFEKSKIDGWDDLYSRVGLSYFEKLSKD